jgi:alpha-beta hydrolase superfamily lysophospholipase
MEVREGHFFGHGNVKLFYREWLPGVEVKGVVVIFHGFGEHIGRYKNVVDKLVPAGFAVLGYDHRGHGLSEGPRTHVDSFEDYLLDGRCFFAEVAEPLAAGKPLFLLGHSMGSIMAMHYVPRYGANLRGCVLSGTGASSLVGNPLLHASAKVASSILPRARVDFPMKSCFISRDWQVVREYDNDPLVEKTLSCRLGNHMNLYMGQVLRRAKEITLPVLIQCGEKDDSFDGADILFASLASEDKTLKIYTACKHEVYNELPEERDKALQDLLLWLEDRV